MMNNIEVESLDKGIVIMGDIALVGWVVLKCGKVTPSRSQAETYLYNSNMLSTISSLSNYW